MRYIAKTPLAKYIRIEFSEPIAQTVSSDKWDSWVFKAQVNGWFDGQQTYTSDNIIWKLFCEQGNRGMENKPQGKI